MLHQLTNLLIIAILVNVECIRYDGGKMFVKSEQLEEEELLLDNSNNFKPLTYNASFNLQPQQQFNYNVVKSMTTTDVNLIETNINDMPTSVVARQMSFKEFRPSQVIDFTLHDVTDVNNKQFKFPTNDNNNNYDYYNKATTQQQQQQPILSYRDPYTNENYPNDAMQLNLILQQQQQPQLQEYVVGSSYYIGGDNNEHHHHPHAPHYNSNNRVLPSIQATRAGERLSYDSHDYPPPHNYAQAQELGGGGITYNIGANQPPVKLSSAMSNYANNFGNYLEGGNTGHEHKRPLSSYEAFNSYQGPTRTPNKYYRPPYYVQETPQRPVIPAPPPAHGLPSLASFLSTTQAYAPQFTNLLLYGIGGGGGGGQSSPSKSPQMRPLRNMQLIKALENIARNDDLQCVPKVLCQMIATQTQRGQLPAFITSPTITK